MSTKTACNQNGYGRNKLPPSPTYRRKNRNHGRKTLGLKPAPSARALKTTTKYTRNSRPKESIYRKPKKNPTVRKTKKTQIRRRSTRESPSAAKAFNNPNCKHHRTQPYSRVIVPGPYRPDRGADGRTCGGLGRGSP